MTIKKAYKISELSGEKIKTKEELPSNLKGKVVVLNHEKSEIAKNLEITENGIFAIKSI